jgi:quercetin dioxygenase-like cupin family protein
MLTTEEIASAIFPMGERAPSEYFTGDVWLKVLTAPDSAHNCQVANVIFEPGARTSWHTHSGGQILLVTDGKGYFQEKGKTARTIHKGDVVSIAPGVEHWHGATPDSELTHIAVNPNAQNGVVDWLDRVDDEAYNNLGNAPDFWG